MNSDDGYIATSQSTNSKAFNTNVVVNPSVHPDSREMLSTTYTHPVVDENIHSKSDQLKARAFQESIVSLAVYYHSIYLCFIFFSHIYFIYFFRNYILDPSVPKYLSIWRKMSSKYCN